MRRIVIALTVMLPILAGAWQLISFINQPTSNVAQAAWNTEYWNNTSQAGKPIYSTQVDTISFDWGDQRPAGVSTSVFSARYTGNAYMDGGRYEFEVTVQGEVHVYINGALIINESSNNLNGSYRGQANVIRGINAVRVDYINRGGAAQVQLNYRQVAAQIDEKPTPTATATKIIVPPFPTKQPSDTGERNPPSTPIPSKSWKVEYFNNPNVSGKPVFVTQATRVYFMWGQAIAARGVNRDQFSARMTKNETFAQGTYRFTARSDDGVRVYVDDDLVIDEWRAQPFGKNYSVDVPMTKGVHQLKVEYFDQGGAAALQFSWVKR